MTAAQQSDSVWIPQPLDALCGKRVRVRRIPEKAHWLDNGKEGIITSAPYDHLRLRHESHRGFLYQICLLDSNGQQEDGGAFYRRDEFQVIETRQIPPLPRLPRTGRRAQPYRPWQPRR